MKNNWLEKGLNDKLGDYGSSIDLEEAWKALEAQRRPEKKKRKFIGWWIFGLSVLIGVLGYFVWGNNNSDTELEHITSKTVEQSTTSYITKSKNINSIENQNSEQLKKPVSDQRVLNNNVDFSKNTKSISLENRNSKILKAQIANTIQTQSPTYQVESIFNNQTAPYGVIKDTPLDINDKTASSTTKQISSAALFSKEMVETVNWLPLVNILLQNSKTEGAKSIDLSRTTLYFELPKSRPTQYIGVETGYGFLTNGKTIEEESTLDAASLNLFYRKNIYKNIYLKSGIYINQYTNKIERNINNTYTQNTDNQLITINQFNNGSVDYIYGMADVEITEKTQFQIFNRYTFVNIPLIIGAEISPSGRSSFQVEGGLSTSVYSKFEGKYFEDIDSQTLTTFEDLDLKKQGVLNGLYAVQWNYVPFKQNTNWEFFLKYQGSIQLNDLSKNDELNIQNFSAQQLLLGTKYRF